MTEFMSPLPSSSILVTFLFSAIPYPKALLLVSPDGLTPPSKQYIQVTMPLPVSSLQNYSHECWKDASLRRYGYKAVVS
jgi:hypothetical protein